MQSEHIAVKRAIERDEFGYLEDGYVYWFPSSKGGAIDAASLEAIAAHLKECNAAWDEEIKALAEQQKILDADDRTYTRVPHDPFAF